MSDVVDVYRARIDEQISHLMYLSARQSIIQSYIQYKSVICHKTICGRGQRRDRVIYKALAKLCAVIWRNSIANRRVVVTNSVEIASRSVKAANLISIAARRIEAPDGLGRSGRERLKTFSHTVGRLLSCQTVRSANTVLCVCGHFAVYLHPAPCPPVSVRPCQCVTAMSAELLKP